MAGSRFIAHVRWWFFIVPLIAVFVMPAIPDSSLFEIPDAEARSVERTLGEARADGATERTNAAFRRFFVETGVVQTTLAATRGGDVDDGGVSSFARIWVRNFWRLVYRAIYRATVMRVWLLGTLVFCTAAFVDGTVRRKIKAAAAGFASPLSFHLAGHGILLLAGVAFAVLVAPVAVFAQYWIVVAATMGALLWKASSSYQ